MHVMISFSGKLVTPFLPWVMAQLYRVKDSVDVFVYSFDNILPLTYITDGSGQPLPKPDDLKLRTLSSVQDDCDSGSEVFRYLAPFFLTKKSVTQISFLLI